MTKEDVSETPNLRLWLVKRNLTCEFFSELIRGKCPPKPLSIDITTEIEIEKNPFAVKSVSPEKNSTSVFKITSTATPVIEDESLLLGMISRKNSIITIFGHKHKIKNFIKKFDIFHKKFTTGFHFTVL